MRPTPLSILILGLSASPAPAGDFGGFYAGVNAGYASGLDGERLSSPTLGLDADGASDDGLPPSARSAADTMVERRAQSRRTAAPRR